ncbi:MAG: FAD-dependent oxidoreductase, partial [Candidatus Lokiarchaeota archaeon]|nr:FAD-dependent oxidoreductase [Candidatus Lokiarchaeota archaeon]
AGFSAAVCSARQGASTCLIEQAGSIGGVATTGFMSHWTGATRGGFYEEIVERSIDCFKDDGTIVGSWQSINTERLKNAMLAMAAEAGVNVRLHTLACAPVMDGSAVAGAITESKSGREAFLAGIVVDATGDGDVAARAGVPFTKGRGGDGKMQPATVMFKVGGVDSSRAVLPGAFESNPDVPAGPIQDLGTKHLPPPAGHVLLYQGTLPGVVTVNMTNSTGVDGTSADDLTRAEIECRGQIEQIVAFLKEYVPGFEYCYLLASAESVGIRETRHFEGEYTLTERDIIEARVFDDWVVAKAHFNFDIHHLESSGLDPTGVQQKFPQPKPYTIPYRCLVPKRVDNLLLAGRNISGTHVAHSSFRVMPICANVGQAAGIAAALCASRGVRPRDLEAAAIQRILLNQGVSP